MIGRSNFRIDFGRDTDIPALRELDLSTERGVRRSEADYRCISDSAFRRLVLVGHSEPEAISGFLVARSVASEWEIENVVVGPSYRQQGLGEKLVQRFLEIALGEGPTTVHLEVRRSNQAAIALYRKCSFREIGVRKAYYSHPEEDALLFSLSPGNSS